MLHFILILSCTSVFGNTHVLVLCSSHHVFCNSTLITRRLVSVKLRRTRSENLASQYQRSVLPIENGMEFKTGKLLCLWRFLVWSSEVSARVPELKAGKFYCCLLMAHMEYGWGWRVIPNFAERLGIKPSENWRWNLWSNVVKNKNISSLASCSPKQCLLPKEHQNIRIIITWQAFRD